MLSIRPSLLVLAAGVALGAPRVVFAADAPPEAPLPLTAVTMHRSGVASFERRGTIDGPATASLRVSVEQVNDLLKSLVVVDLGDAPRATVSYASKDPLERRLRAFALDLSDNPGVATILSRLRGAPVSLATIDGPAEGTILSVETRQVPAPGAGGTGGAVLNEPFVNLLTPTGVRSYAVSRLTSFDVRDPRIAEELRLALAAIAEGRDARTATVDVSFAGEGRREVGLAYVLEAPVWKASYRLVLPDDSSQDASLQGWAIVENTTDEDWRNIRLALASSNPVGFRMDLHEPLFLDRPTLPVPAALAARARVYEQEIALAQSKGASSPLQRAAARAPMMSAMADGAESAGMEGLGADALARYAPAALAGAGQAGEQFRYEIREPVSIERQRSAMLPVLTERAKARRVSVFAAGDAGAHPMRGVELRNTPAFDLAPGPVTVYDGPAYAGDAQLGFTGRGQERLLAYAVDLDVTVVAEERADERVASLRVARGVIEQTLKTRATTAYTIANRDAARGRTLLIEQPRTPGFDLVSPPAAAETETARRFEVELEPALTGARFEVVTERTDIARTAVAGLSAPAILAFVQSGRASPEVAEALRAAADRAAAVDAAQQEVARLDREREAISADQARVRANMGAVDRASDLYTRYIKTLAEQETRLDALREQRADAERRLAETRKALEEFIANLDVG